LSRMNIEHIAVWVRDLELMREFYRRYFGAVAGPKYENPQKRFESYFLLFDGGARLELMRRVDISEKPPVPSLYLGLAHFAISVGSESDVDHLTGELRLAGYHVAAGPRMTGDGYYESVVLDPEGNRIEITTDLPEKR
jgi:lactoylglutathione lyase